MNRRLFLKIAGIGGAGLIWPRVMAAAEGSDLGQLSRRDYVTPTNWAERPMRWTNLNLVENDPADFDPEFWLSFFKRCHSDATCLSAGGVVAYYPTKIPLHHRSVYLAERDCFGEMVDGCRRQGMAVMARVDPHAVHQDIADAHPDWLAVDAEGHPRRHWLAKDLWVTCPFGPMNFEFMPTVIEEIVREYRVDAVYANRWEGSYMCYCSSCRRQFRAATQRELPNRLPSQPPASALDWSINPADPTWRAYARWRSQRMQDIWERWDRAVRKHNDHACFVPNQGGGMRALLDMKYTGDRATLLVADRQGRAPTQAPWAIGIAAKEFRAVMDHKPLTAGISLAPQNRYRPLNGVNNLKEIEIWLASAIANGIRPSIGKTGMKVDDSRWMPMIENLFSWHQRNEAYFRNTRPVARAAILTSQQTRVYGGRNEDALSGFYQALLELREPFEMVHENALAPERLGRYQLIILPGIAALSDAQCDRLREYVTNGGSLIATFDTSLCDEWGQRRADFGLADLFGASFAGIIEGPLNNSYMRLQAENTPGGRHPLLAGFEGTQRIINTVSRVKIWPKDSTQPAPLTHIPPYPSLPMEDLYPRITHTDEPLVIAQQVGKGRVVYFPGDLARTYWEQLLEDHGRLLRNAVCWTLRDPAPVKVEGPGFLDVTVWEQAASLTVHVVNLTNPMAMRGYFREFIPLGGLSVSVQLPEGRNVIRVKLLVAGKEIAAAVSGGRLQVKLPEILAHEVIAVDLA